jgi:2-iminobutanoate/2-iminopropanoate deaminase
MFCQKEDLNMRRALNSTKLVKPAFRYSHVVNAGPHWYMSGLLAQHRETGTLVGTTPGEQAVQILENLQVLMDEFSLGFGDLAMARIFTTDMQNFSQINAAWEAVFDKTDEPPPARTSIGVAALPLNALVEMEFTFYRD